jgi:hypothetical protein
MPPFFRPLSQWKFHGLDRLAGYGPGFLGLMPPVVSGPKIFSKKF